MLHLFGARVDLVRYGADHYRIRSEETSTLLLQLFQRYLREGPAMPDALEEFARETIKEILNSLSDDELRKRLSPQKRLQGLSPQERVEGLSPDDLAAALKAALSPEARDALARRLQEEGPLHIRNELSGAKAAKYFPFRRSRCAKRSSPFSPSPAGC
jgi:hypothetical protein